MPLFLLLGCGLGDHHRIKVDPKVESWNAAQAAFEERAEEGGAARARTALDAAIEADPRNLPARGLRARLEWTYGFAAEVGLPEDEVSARAHYINAAEIANACLQKDPAFNAALAAAHGNFTAYGLAALPPEAVPCLTWGAAATLSLTQLRGPGAVLALWNTPLLLRRAMLLDPTDKEGWLNWLEGQQALFSEPPDPKTGAALLRKASLANPSMALFRLYLPAESRSDLPAIPNASPNDWENRLAAAWSQD